MQIIVIGDVHGDFNAVDKIMEKEKDIHLFFCVGDVVDYSGEYWSPKKRLFMICGNHENWDVIEGLDNGTIYIGNLFHIKTGVKYYPNEFSIVGLNGNYAPSKYDKPKPKGIKGFDFRDGRRHFNKSDVEKVIELGQADILLTHEAPQPFAILRKSGMIDEVGIPIINGIKEVVMPKWHFFGHHHRKRIINHNSIGLPYPKREYIVLDTKTWEFEWRVTK